MKSTTQIVEETVKSWNEMTSSERKIALCKDVLSRLDQNELRMDLGGYIEWFNYSNQMVLDGVITGEQCSLMRKNSSVCAKGALLLSRIDKFNTLEWDDLYYTHFEKGESIFLINEESILVGLEGAFSKHELGMIECAFETNDYFLAFEYKDLASLCKEFGEKFSKPTERMRAICKNVIQNNGEFCP